jgi:EAL domain-containing protein (putative c-di-GMP-specific phosphodiesterase class I)
LAERLGAENGTAGGSDAIEELRSAIDAGQLEVHYQPIVDRLGAVVAVEALARWAHPTRGLLLPSAFIPLAEEGGFILELGRHVLADACRQVAAWRESHATIELAANVSVQELADPRFESNVSEALAVSGLPASALRLEITENAMMNAPDTTEAVLSLRNTGLRVAVDDFGTGFRPLVALRHLPVDNVKIDRFFVSGLSHSEKATMIVRSVIDLAHRLGLTATAEGVETDDQAAYLRSVGCDYFQGHYWMKAADAGSVGACLPSVRQG